MKCFIPEGKSLSANQVVQLLQEPYTEQDLSDPNWRVEDMVAVIEANKEEHKADLMNNYESAGRKMPHRQFSDSGGSPPPSIVEVPKAEDVFEPETIEQEDAGASTGHREQAPLQKVWIRNMTT